MIELEISAITARAHARQLHWLLERCREEDAGKAAIDEIQQIIVKAEHLADFSGIHAEDECCLQCQGGAVAQPSRRSWLYWFPSRRWLRLEAAWQLLHVADESLIAVAPDWMVLSRAPEIVVQAKRWLGPEDPRLNEVAALVTPAHRRAESAVTVSRVDRYTLAGLLHAIHYTWDRSYARARSFRHLLVTACVLLSVAMVALVAVGVISPPSLPMCTADPHPVCVSGSPSPTAGDVALVALIGAIAAGFSAVAGVANLRPLVDPYRTPIVQGLLKVPTGAFTAVLGVLAVEQALQASAGLPSSQGGMLFLAFVFGYSQQLVTRFVDTYGAQIRAGLAGQRTRGGTSQSCDHQGV
jgi:hypothetical protein